MAEAIGFDRGPPELAMTSYNCEKAKFGFSPEQLNKLRSSPYWVSKRLIDIALALLLLVGLLPPDRRCRLFSWPSTLVLPLIFWQERPGVGGRPFRLYTFRTMQAAYDKSGKAQRA